MNRRQAEKYASYRPAKFQLAEELCALMGWHGHYGPFNVWMSPLKKKQLEDLVIAIRSGGKHLKPHSGREYV